MFTAQQSPGTGTLGHERKLEVENEGLRARVAMLEAENSTLLARITELVTQLATEIDKDKQLALSLELQLLQRRIKQKNREQFGSKSEKRGRRGKGNNKRSRGSKHSGSERTKQPKLATATRLHLLDEADRVCPGCGGTLYPKQGRFESCERVAVSERVYTLVTDHKQIYGCGDGCGATDTALAPAQLVAGGRYDSGVAVQIAVDKYVDHQPLNRQVAAMKRAGLTMSRQSVWDQLNALARLCAPTYLALHCWMLTSHELLHADETTWRMMLEGGSLKWWMWALAAPDGFFCMISPTRGTDAGRLLLRDFDGVLMSDAYAVYKKLAAEALQETLDLADERPWHPRFEHAVCWSHARRPFEQASKDDDDAHEILDFLAELYEIEARAKRMAGGDEEKLLEIRARLRDTESRAVVDKIARWRAQQFALPGTKMDEGLVYLRNQWRKLTYFLDAPLVPLDNNLAERQVRAVVLGRKNHLGSHSERGAQVAAIFYSLLGSCRLVGVSPNQYLNTLVQRALADPDYTLLPHEFAAELAAKPAAG